MFCSNCGKQIPDNNKFCNHCGAQQTANNYINATPQQENPAPTTRTAPPTVPQQTTIHQPVYTAQQQFQQPQGKPPKKKSVGIVISLIVILVVFLLGRFVVAPAITKGFNTGKVPADNSSKYTFQQPDNQSNDTTTNNTNPNPAYKEIFDGTYIVHSPMFFNLETASFAQKGNDGTIMCCDYGYKDDLVLQMVETTYIPVTGYTDDQKAKLENETKTNAAAYEGMNSMIVKYEMGTRYFSITVKYGGLDRADYREELVKVGILKENNPISMSASERQQIADGAVKK